MSRFIELNQVVTAGMTTYPAPSHRFEGAADITGSPLGMASFPARAFAIAA